MQVCLRAHTAWLSMLCAERQDALHAGAGTGKTSTLVGRVWHMLVTHKIPAASILAVTFTRKAALELRGRLQKLGAPGADRLQVAIFHSWSYRILRENYRAAGFTQMPAVWGSNKDRMDVCREALRWVSICVRDSISMNYQSGGTYSELEIPSAGFLSWHMTGSQVQSQAHDNHDRLVSRLLPLGSLVCALASRTHQCTSTSTTTQTIAGSNAGAWLNLCGVEQESRPGEGAQGRDQVAGAGVRADC